MRGLRWAEVPIQYVLQVTCQQRKFADALYLWVFRLGFRTAVTLPIGNCRGDLAKMKHVEFQQQYPRRQVTLVVTDSAGPTKF